MASFREAVTGSIVENDQTRQNWRWAGQVPHPLVPGPASRAPDSPGVPTAFSHSTRLLFCPAKPALHSAYSFPGEPYGPDMPGILGSPLQLGLCLHSFTGCPLRTPLPEIRQAILYLASVTFSNVGANVCDAVTLVIFHACKFRTIWTVLPSSVARWWCGVDSFITAGVISAYLGDQTRENTSPGDYFP